MIPVRKEAAVIIAIFIALCQCWGAHAFSQPLTPLNVIPRPWRRSGTTVVGDGTVSAHIGSRHHKILLGVLAIRALSEDGIDESLPAPQKARFLLKAAQVDLQIDLTLRQKEVEWKRSPPPERALVACEAGGAELVCELIQVIRSGSMNGRSWLRPLFLQRPLSNGGLENARLGSVPEPLGAAELPVGAGAGSTAGLERCDLRGGHDIFLPSGLLRDGAALSPETRLRAQIARSTHPAEMVDTRETGSQALPDFLRRLSEENPAAFRPPGGS